ncbi:hypothetical protein RN001_015321 [Aquatica leii]|uniref:Kinetochore protein NDC80 n=1 Tax=Aquatica leii TaxID=1421715 RepID=A0AAN7PQM9_9COLE|nr:hypothetical protein RN001_015321 [Aquatica leii]
MSATRNTNLKPGEVASRLSRLPVKISGVSRISRSSVRPSHVTQKQSIDKNLRRSKSISTEQLRLSRQRSSSLLKQSTPLMQNVRSARKSPCVTSTQKDNRPISDKRWQQEQLIRVRDLISLYLPDLDYRLFKPGMSLDFFITLSGRLFQMIDKRLVISKENYMEEVPANLKLFNYPTSIKPSLMKSVNTPHSWPSVIAMISWLIDVVDKINRTEDSEETLGKIVDNHIKKLFWMTMNENNDPESIDAQFKELDEKLVEFFNINEDALKREENEIKLLRAKKMEHMDTSKQHKDEIKALREKIDTINYKCNQYKSASEDYEKNLLEKQELLTKNSKKLDEELEKLNEIKGALRKTIESQPHTLAEKQLLMSDIESLQNTVKLKEERRLQQIDLIHTVDHQLSDLCQKLQADAYAYNNIISSLEINDCGLKELHIRESGFMKSDTNDELRRIEKLLRIANKKVRDETQIVVMETQELAEKHELVSEQLASANKELEELDKMNAEQEYLMEQKNTKVCREIQLALEQVNLLRNQLTELKTNRPQTQDLEEELQNVSKKYADAVAARFDLQSKATEFFVSLDNQISSSIIEYMGMLTTLTDSFVSTINTLTENSKVRVESFEAGNKEIEELINRNDDST